LTRSLNKYHLKLCLIILLLTLLSQGTAFSQVFPEVNDPVRQKIKEREEKEKLGMFYYNDQQYDKAAEVYKELFDNNLTHFYYTYYLYSLLALREYEEADKAVRTMIKTSQRSVRYQVDQGYILQLQDKFDKAYRHYDNVINSLRPIKPEIMETASAFVSRQVFEYAVKTYEKGRELLNDNNLFHEDLARIFEITGDYKMMIEEYLKLLQADPTKMEYVQGRLQNTLNRDNDNTVSEILRESLLLKSQKNPDDRNLSQMLLWLSIQRKDFEFALVQAISLDKRFSENGYQVFSLGNLALSNQDFTTAAKSFQYILDMGPASPFYLESLTGNLQARFLGIVTGVTSDREEFVNLEKEYLNTLQDFGYNPRTIFLMRDLAHLQAFYLDKIDEAVEILDKAVAMPNVNPNTIADCKLELGDILLYKGEVWDASLLYSQVEKSLKNEPAGHEAKFRNARLSYYIGEFEWAKAQLDVLKAATSKLIANDALELSLLIADNMDLDSTYTALGYYSHADLLTYMNKYEEALPVLDTIRMLGLYHSLDDEVLFKKAEICLKMNRFEEADSLLAKVVSDYSRDILADNALFKRAELQETVFGDTETAMKLYQQVLTEYPGSLFVTESRKRFRLLRGDQPPDGNPGKHLLP
jgi:tetratricopeptide (TPR) repeat protein